MGSVADLKREMIEKYKTGKQTYSDFPIGTKVKVITPCQDFHFFYGETGIVTLNTYGYLGINVKFDKPRHFDNGMIQKDFGFEPEDLLILENPTCAIQFVDGRSEIEILKAEIEKLQEENKQLKLADKDHLSARKGLEARFEQKAAEIKSLKASMQLFIDNYIEADYNVVSELAVAAGTVKRFQLELQSLENISVGSMSEKDTK